MPKKKKFEVRITVHLPQKLADFLDELVEKGVAENISQAVRTCIAVCKQYVPTIKLEAKEIKEEGELEE